MTRRTTWPVLWLILIVLVSLLPACGPDPGPTIVPTSTPLPITSPAYQTAIQFLDGWAAGDYRSMYALCSTDVRANVPYGEFQRIYQEIADEATALAVRPTLGVVLQEGPEALATFTAEVETSFVGSFTVENELPLVWERGRWAVVWSKQCIFPEREGDNLVHMDSRAPIRANIYDVNGKGLAIQGARITVGVVPGQIENETGVLAKLRLVLGLPQPGPGRGTSTRRPCGARLRQRTVPPLPQGGAVTQHPACPCGNPEGLPGSGALLPDLLRAHAPSDNHTEAPVTPPQLWPMAPAINPAAMRQYVSRAPSWTAWSGAMRPL